MCIMAKPYDIFIFNEFQISNFEFSLILNIMMGKETIFGFYIFEFNKIIIISMWEHRWYNAAHYMNVLIQL